MIREKFEHLKNNLNIGTIGPVEHGKIAFTAPIPATLTIFKKSVLKNYNEIDFGLEEKARRITINTARILKNRLNHIPAQYVDPGKTTLTAEITATLLKLKNVNDMAFALEENVRLIDIALTTCYYLLGIFLIIFFNFDKF